MSVPFPLARNLRAPRTLALLGALLLCLAALLARPIPLQRQGVALLAVVDITGSMNVRDYTLDGAPASRLDVAKLALRRLVAELPCGSRFALGLFTDRRPFLLFAPIEVCADFAPLDGALAALDWRMAWEGDSHVSAGLIRSIELAAEISTDLLFEALERDPIPYTEVRLRKDLSALAYALAALGLLVLTLGKLAEADFSLRPVSASPARETPAGVDARPRASDRRAA